MTDTSSQFSDPFGSDNDATPEWVPALVGVALVAVLVIVFVFRVPPFHNRPPIFGGFSFSAAYTPVPSVVDDSAQAGEDNVIALESFFTAQSPAVFEDIEIGSSIAYDTQEFLTDSSIDETVEAFIDWMSSDAIAVSSVMSNGGAIALDFVEVDTNRTVVFVIVSFGVGDSSLTRVLVRTLRSNER